MVVSINVQNQITSHKTSAVQTVALPIHHKHLWNPMQHK